MSRVAPFSENLTLKVPRGMYYEYMNEQSNRPLMTRALAVVGFVAVIGASMWFAVYSTRYVPDIVTRLGSAAVYLGSVFTPAPSLSVVPTQTASSTLPFTEASSTPISAAPVAPKKVAPAAGQKTSGAFPIGGTVASTTLTGLPDLTVTINAVGYFTSTSTDSFVASSTVPVGRPAAVNFTIKNIGTNATDAWCFSVTIPTQTAYLYQSQPQRLSDNKLFNPGDSIDYTLGFDQANKGIDQLISITANTSNASNPATCAHSVVESNTNNDSASAKVTILGS